MRDIRPFKLERYFAVHEFRTRYLLSASDCESMLQSDLLALADAEGQALWRDLWLGYTESQGHPLLRDEIARLYDGLTAEQVLVAAPEEGILIAMHALLSPGDEVIVTWPAYQSLAEIAASLGCRIVPWSLALAGGAWQLDADVLPRLITPRTRLVVVNFPHNPTGFLPDRATFERIVHVVAERGIYLFSDEMYRLLEYEPAQRLAAGCDLYERGMTLSGLSKAFGLPGLRIGWLATRDEGLFADCARLKDYTTICSSAPSEILAIIALRAGEQIVARTRQIVLENLALADAFFARHAALFEWPRPLAGPVAFPRWRSDANVRAFCDDVLAAASVMIVPGDLFEFEGGHFRLGLGRRNFAQALAEVERYLENRS